MTYVGFIHAVDAKGGVDLVKRNVRKTKPQPAERLAPALFMLLKQMSSWT